MTLYDSAALLKGLSKDDSNLQIIMAGDDAAVLPR